MGLQNGPPLFFPDNHGSITISPTSRLLLNDIKHELPGTSFFAQTPRGPDRTWKILGHGDNPGSESADTSLTP